MIAPDGLTPEQRLEQVRRDHAYRARIWRWIIALDAGFWLILFSIFFPPAPRLVWNASASAPVGLYGMQPRARLARGDMVIAWVPKSYRQLAAVRRYIPENVPLVKRVAAVAGDRICADGASIWVNGKVAVTRLAQDGRGRPMPWWSGCRILGEREYFLLMAKAPASFDGRYFGITDGADIVGRATPLWTR